MSTRHLFSVVLLAALVLDARASFYFTWNAPGAVNVGQNYTVGVQAYFTPSYSGDPYATLGLYRNGSQVGGGGTSAYGSATASNSFTDNSPQTVGYSADVYSYYGESDYSSHSVTVNGAPANNPPTAWVTVDGRSHGATVTRPYGGSVSVTVRYKASDPDNNLARIRPQVWHPSGYLNNNGGNFIGQSGGYGEVAWTVNLNENGNWHFWTDAEDTNNVFVNSGAWSAGFRLTVVEGAPPNTPPTVVLHSPSAQTIYLNQALTITSQATDPDNNIAHHNLDIQRPDGSWNWQGGFANGHPYTGGYNGSPGNSNRSASFTFNQLGTWYVRSAAADSSGWYHSATVAINVVNAPDTTPPGNPHSLQVSNLTSSSFTLSWSAPSDNVGVTGYRVRLNEGAATNVSGLSHTFSGLAANTNYAAQVSARDAAGNWSGWAGAGAATGSPGGGGTQAESSVWRDIMGGDGILDEIVRAGTAEFYYYVNEWYTTNYSYAYLPINNYWHWWKIFWEPQTYYENFTSSWEHSHQFWVSYDAFFELAFEIGISYNHPFRIYRDRSASEQINLSEWELLINSVGSPGGFTMISYPLQDPADLPGTQYFMVKQGLPISSVQIKNSAGNVLETNVGAGGTPSVNLPADGKLQIPVYDVQGHELPIEPGEHTLTWIIEGVANVANNVINGVGKVLDLAGVVPLSNNQVVVKLKLDNSDQYFTFVLTLPNVPSASPIAFVRDGQNDHVVDGSDPVITYARIGHWGADRADGGVTGYDTNGSPLYGATPNNFIDRDPERFHVRIVDSSANADPNTKDRIVAKIGTLTGSNAVDDNLTDFTLEETSTNSGIFVSESQLLMSIDVKLPSSTDPEDADDGYKVGSKYSIAFVADDAAQDRTHRATVDGHVRVEYQLGSQLVTALIPVGQREPEEGRVLKITINNFYEPWTDSNNNGQYDANEPFVDISNGARSLALNGTRGKIWQDNEIELMLTGLRAALAAARIRVEVVATNVWEPSGNLFKQPGTMANGESLIGLVDVNEDEIATNTIARDHQQIHTQFHPQGFSNVVHVYFCPPLAEKEETPSLTSGMAVTPSYIQEIRQYFYMPASMLNVTFVFLKAARDGKPMTLGHEIYHHLTNEDDIDTPSHILFPSISVGSGDSPYSARRVQESTVQKARTERPQGEAYWGQTGNTLLTVVEPSNP